MNTIRVSNGLDPDQDPHSGPDLGPNCLQRLSADNKSCFSSKDKVMTYIFLKIERPICKKM